MPLHVLRYTACRRSAVISVKLVFSQAPANTTRQLMRASVSHDGPVYSPQLALVTHDAYPRRDGSGWVDLGVTHPGTNRARRRVTTLTETNVLPLNQTKLLVTITDVKRLTNNFCWRPLLHQFAVRNADAAHVSRNLSTASRHRNLVGYRKGKRTLPCKDPHQQISKGFFSLWSIWPAQPLATTIFRHIILTYKLWNIKRL